MYQEAVWLGELFVPKTTDSVTGTAGSDEKKEGSSETAAADVARDHEGAGRDEVILKGLDPPTAERDLEGAQVHA